MRKKKKRRDINKKIGKHEKERQKTEKKKETK